MILTLVLFLIRKNMILMHISIEIMLLAITLLVFGLIFVIDLVGLTYVIYIIVIPIKMESNITNLSLQLLLLESIVSGFFGRGARLGASSLEAALFDNSCNISWLYIWTCLLYFTSTNGGCRATALMEKP
jgi:NADH:ubiquinone oxidoreductase subunit K